jgi:hypothetical protein
MRWEAQKPETIKLDSGKPESNIPETAKLDSRNQVSEFPPAVMTESGLEASPTLADAFSQARKPESGIPENSNSELEYKKVAMRLSAEAVESLRQLRATTGVPYEILVDVMIRNWGNLPDQTQAAYLQQAKQIRMKRLIFGQEKTMKTIKAKYLG